MDSDRLKQINRRLEQIKQEQEDLHQKNIQLVLEDCRLSLQKLLRDATVEPVEGGFVVHGCRKTMNGKAQDIYLADSQTLAARDFWEVELKQWGEEECKLVSEWLLKH